MLRSFRCRSPKRRSNRLGAQIDGRTSKRDRWCGAHAVHNTDSVAAGVLTGIAAVPVCGAAVVTVAARGGAVVGCETQRGCAHLAASGAPAATGPRRGGDRVPLFP